MNDLYWLPVGCCLPEIKQANLRLTRSLVNSIYRQNSGNSFYLQFLKQFNLTSSKDDHQRHLIYIWCCLLRLPTYRRGTAFRWRYQDFLENCNVDFEIKLDELKSFLRQRSWPLPVALFPNELDNTAAVIEKSTVVHAEAFDQFIDVLPKLIKNREELQNIQPESMTAYREKKEELRKFDSQIEAIKTGQPIEASNASTAVSTTEQPSPKYLFRRNSSGTWDVIFDGAPCPSLPNYKGFHYIHFLMKNAKKNFSALDLTAMVDQPLHRATLDISDHSELVEADSFSGNYNEPDENALAQYQESYNEIEKEFKNAKALGDIDRAEKIEEEMQFFVKEIKRGKNRKRREKRKQPETGSSQKKAQDNVRANIKNTLRMIGKSCPKLAEHLNSYLSRGPNNRYDPQDAPNWVLE